MGNTVQFSSSFTAVQLDRRKNALNGSKVRGECDINVILDTLSQARLVLQSRRKQKNKTFCQIKPVTLAMQVTLISQPISYAFEDRGF